MGTRADFYIGLGKDAEWLGSIAWDGYPGGIDAAVMDAGTEQEFRANLLSFFDGRDDVTPPERGWPWPWNDSRTTDYSYWFSDGKVFVSCCGHKPAPHPLADDEGEEDDPNVPDGEFPDMTNRKNVRFDRGSGILIMPGLANSIMRPPGSACEGRSPEPPPMTDNPKEDREQALNKVARGMLEMVKDIKVDGPHWGLGGSALILYCSHDQAQALIDAITFARNFKT